MFDPLFLPVAWLLHPLESFSVWAVCVPDVTLVGVVRSESPGFATVGLLLIFVTIFEGGWVVEGEIVQHGKTMHVGVPIPKWKACFWGKLKG